jgi:dihydrofolate reductase
MRKVVLKMSMSIDGFVGGPKGEIDWIFRSRSDDGAAWIVDTLAGAGLHAMGSRTFRDMASYWPTAAGPFAAPMNRIPKVVFSAHGLDDAAADATLESWRSPRVARGDLSEEIARLKDEDDGGGYILAHGGASFAQSLVERGLVDEYRLVIHPVVLGRGLPLFSKLTAPHDLRLIETKSFSTGTVAHVYRPV